MSNVPIKPNENVFILIGRLKRAIKDGKNSRALQILELVTDKVSRMDIDLPESKRELF